MGYLYIFFGVFANAAKAASSKFASKTINTLRSNTCFNGARNILCCIIALGMAFAVDLKGITVISLKEILICTASGIAMAVFTVSWTFAVKGEAYMLVSAFNSANFIIPCAVGFLFLGERMTLGKGFATLLIIIALYLMVGHNFKIKGRLTPKALFMLISVMLSGGANNAMQKLYSVTVLNKSVAYYTFYTFLVAGVLMLVLTAFFKRGESLSGALNIGNFKHLIIMALGMFFATYFQSLAAKTLDSVILYPTLNALSLIAGSVMSALLFKERITKKCVAGMVLVFSALMLSKF